MFKMPENGENKAHVIVSSPEQVHDSDNSKIPVAGPSNSFNRLKLHRLRSLPTSVASSREGSPRSTVSEAPSMATLAMARLAQYRAGARTFKPDASERSGLSTGDVVAFRTRGVFLAAIPISIAGLEPDTVLHILTPSDIVDPTDPVCHLEIIRQGQWIGLRSSMASDRLLQARRKGAHRLAFFSQNVGTWEQWEVAETTALDSVPWTKASITLRNRRLPSCELRVEMVRIGMCTMMPHAAVTPRSIMPTTISASSSIEADCDPTQCSENPNIRRMSGLLVNEWLTFVEREKKLRGALEARIEQAIEDAAGLREWAALQVEGVRKDVEEEVELLLAALSRKSAALEDAQSRLETRIRWGVALLEAKKAAVLGRRIVNAWKAFTGRAKYCRNVVSKLQERSSIRMTARIMIAWSEHCLDQRIRRQRLRAAVKRMAYLKMQSFMQCWRDTVQQRKIDEERESNLVSRANARVREWNLRQCFGAWKERSRRAHQATKLLTNMANRSDHKLVQTLFVVWQERMSQQKIALTSLTIRAAATNRRATLESAIDAWRVTVDDTFGGKLQLVHAQRVISRRRGVRALHAWRGVVETTQAEAALIKQVETYENRRRTIRVLTAWREFTSDRKDNRDVFVRFVHTRAERRMHMALAFWRCYTAWKIHSSMVVRHMVERRSMNSMTNVFAVWREETAIGRVHNHRVAMCNRKHRISTLHKALSALQNHAAETVHERELDMKAQGWYAGRLQASGLWAFVEAINRRRDFETALISVAQSQEKTLVRNAWDLWQQCAGQQKALEVNIYRFQVRRQWFILKNAFATWHFVTMESQNDARLLNRGVSRINSSRMRWTLSVWRNVTEEEFQERVAVSFGQRRLNRIKMINAWRAWHSHTEWSIAVQENVEEMEERRRIKLLQSCMHAWAAQASLEAQQRAGVIRLVKNTALARQYTVLSAWRERTAIKSLRRIQMERCIARLNRLRLAHSVAAWRQVSEDAHGERIRLGTVGLTLAIRHQELNMKRVFSAWRGRNIEIRASLQGAASLHSARGAALLRFAFSSWKHLSEGLALRRERNINSMTERRSQRMLAVTFAAWKYESRVSSRNAIILLHRVEKAATGACRVAFDAWRQSARDHIQKRTALVRFMQRWNAIKLKSAMRAWHSVSAAKAAATEELKRCILRKHVAFKQFKQWYWESFDEDLQATLKAMFDAEVPLDAGSDVDEEERGGREYTIDKSSSSSTKLLQESHAHAMSLLKSSIRSELEHHRESSSTKNVTSSSPFTTARDKVHAVLAACSESPAPPSVHAIPGQVECTGSAVVAPLVDWFSGNKDTEIQAYPSLSPVPEVSESPLRYCDSDLSNQDGGGGGDEDYYSPRVSHHESTSGIASSQASTVNESKIRNGLTTATVTTTVTHHGNVSHKSHDFFTISSSTGKIKSGLYRHTPVVMKMQEEDPPMNTNIYAVSDEEDVMTPRMVMP